MYSLRGLATSFKFIINSMQVLQNANLSIQIARLSCRDGKRLFGSSSTPEHSIIYPLRPQDPTEATYGADRAVGAFSGCPVLDLLTPGD